MKRTFFILTERKRVKRRISFYISEVIDGKLKLIDNDFTVSSVMHRGLEDEAVGQLVKLNMLDKKYITPGGYINHDEKDFNIIHVESTDLAYVNVK